MKCYSCKEELDFFSEGEEEAVKHIKDKLGTAGPKCPKCDYTFHAYWLGLCWGYKEGRRMVEGPKELDY